MNSIQIGCDEYVIHVNSTSNKPPTQPVKYTEHRTVDCILYGTIIYKFERLTKRILKYNF
jgi:hypothetical protein